MSRTRRTALALLVGLAGAVLGSTSAAGAQEGAGVTVGWWTRSPAQSAPEGGFAVASAPDGPVTVAAVVFDVRNDIAAGTLTAQETGGVGQAGATVVVCPASGPVTVPDEPGGAFGDAPEPACDRGSVPFERDADSRRWSADVSALVAGLGGDVSLMLVPGPREGPLPPTFDVRFAAPEAQLRLVPAETPTQPETSPSPDPETSAAPPTPPRQPETFSAGPPTSPNPPAAPPLFDTASPTVEPTVPHEDTAPETDDDSTGEETAAPLLPTARTTSGGGAEVGKAFTYVLLSALAGAVVTGASRASRGRRLGA